MKEKKYSLDGEYAKAKNKKYQEIIFFVHFYDGNRRALRRHRDLCLGLGFDCFSFTFNTPKSFLQLKFSSSGHFGLKHDYADQIEKMMNEVPGQKIVYAFSNPCASAMEAMARRNFGDIKAMICDSGPSGIFLQSTVNILRERKTMPRDWMNLISSPFWGFLWSPKFHSDLHDHLNEFPDGFPLLSIRGWKDELISAEQIDRAFEPHKQLAWRKLSLPQAKHLKGLKDFPDDYIPPVQSFLESVATKVC